MVKNEKVIRISREEIDKVQHKRKSKKKINFMNLLFIVFLVYSFITLNSQYGDIQALDKKINEKQEKSSEMREISEGLQKDVEMINDHEVLLKVVEKIARNDYKMVKPNEIIYIDKNKVNNKFVTGIGVKNN